MATLMVPHLDTRTRQVPKVDWQGYTLLAQRSAQSKKISFVLFSKNTQHGNGVVRDQSFQRQKRKRSLNKQAQKEGFGTNFHHIQFPNIFILALLFHFELYRHQQQKVLAVQFICYWIGFGARCEYCRGAFQRQGSALCILKRLTVGGNMWTEGLHGWRGLIRILERASTRHL